MRGIEIQSDIKLGQKILYINWGLVALITIIACIGFSCLYSAAGGSLSPWATPQIVRFMMGMCGMLVVALIDIRFWYKMAYPCFALGMVLLVVVEAMGHVGMGAQRWINLGFMKLQPSEVMKIAVVMALARYFHAVSVDDVRRITFLIPAALIVLAPVGLVLLQPDLGTSLMIIMAGLSVFFVAGAPLWMFISGIVGTVASVPVAWHFLHDYQKKRVMTFLDPESDPLGAGYHITQSKIALGSGGMEGKGFLEGTQSRL
ncbi:MAG: FtsW/RodA/SpoVE family cell cycle protein, partial [Pseudomonadota bacterium]|nr:FtsW/RodA/SpoVE family cell cycle protein [Pseudomonadota bacterium]